MSRAEIRKKFDEIVAFAEVEKFLDTPVKRYSSGMYVRLAFAVAAHLEPEILIVDEVLAVGDAEFQKKCLGKMRVVGRAAARYCSSATTWRAIAALCRLAMLLHNGSIAATGAPREVLTEYLAGDQGEFREWRPDTCRDTPFAFNAVRVETNVGGVARPISYADAIHFVFDYSIQGDLPPAGSDPAHQSGGNYCIDVREHRHKHEPSASMAARPNGGALHASRTVVGAWPLQSTLLPTLG